MIRMVTLSLQYIHINQQSLYIAILAVILAVCIYIYCTAEYSWIMGKLTAAPSFWSLAGCSDGAGDEFPSTLGGV